MDEVIDQIISIFDEHFYEYESTPIANDGIYFKHKIEAIIEEGDMGKDGEMMPWGLFIPLIITFRKGNAHFFHCEFVDTKTGQIMNYIYQPDYHLFLNELERVLKAKGMPF